MCGKERVVRGQATRDVTEKATSSTGSRGSASDKQ